MTTATSVELGDQRLRLLIYELLLQLGRVPRKLELADALFCSNEELDDALRRLHERKWLVLQEDGEILMAHPFSAVPTPFVVHTESASWWGNCIWDALGIPTALGVSARIQTACGCCNDSLRLTVEQGALRDGEGVVHFAVPPKNWWDNIVHT
jgi:hypothetical protein